MMKNIYEVKEVKTNIYMRMLGALEGRDETVIAEYNQIFDCIVIYTESAKVAALLKHSYEDGKITYTVLGVDAIEESFENIYEMCEYLTDNDIIKIP